MTGCLFLKHSSFTASWQRLLCNCKVPARHLSGGCSTLWGFLTLHRLETVHVIASGERLAVQLSEQRTDEGLDLQAVKQVFRRKAATLQRLRGGEAVIDLWWRSESPRGVWQRHDARCNQWPLTSQTHRCLSGHQLITAADCNLILWNKLKYPLCWNLSEDKLFNELFIGDSGH